VKISLEEAMKHVNFKVPLTVERHFIEHDDGIGGADIIANCTLDGYAILLAHTFNNFAEAVELLERAMDALADADWNVSPKSFRVRNAIGVSLKTFKTVEVP